MILFALWKMNRRHKEDDLALDEELKREQGHVGFHTMNWLMQQMISMTKKS